MKESYIFLAEGFEEVEALAVVDVLRRASIPVTTVSITKDKKVTGAHGITVLADAAFGEISLDDALWLICPGGMPGAINLHEYGPLCDALQAHDLKKGRIAAICAAPAVVLAPLGILEGKDATCYPGFENTCREAGATTHDTPVIESENVITANGPASAMCFALAIVKATLGDDAASTIGAGLLFYPESTNFYF